jgi:SET domain-containing protein
VFCKSVIHGTGGFARTQILAETQVIEYVGEKISKAESALRCERNNEYIFDLDEEHDLDGNVEWTPARFINHSCSPNCEALEDENGRIWIVAFRDIRAGEELTFNYGYDLEDYCEHPCRCGAAECVGLIVAEDYFPQVRRQSEALELAP